MAKTSRTCLAYEAGRVQRVMNIRSEDNHASPFLAMCLAQNPRVWVDSGCSRFWGSEFGLQRRGREKHALIIETRPIPLWAWQDGIHLHPLRTHCVP